MTPGEATEALMFARHPLTRSEISGIVTEVTVNTAQDIAALVKDVQETEARYLLHGPRHNPVVTPWMPYQPADFIGIVWECMTEITNSKPAAFAGGEPIYHMPAFLDVGCGPGTKMQIASALFGFQVHGIEIDAAMAFDAAQRQFRTSAEVEHADALFVPDGYYGNFDLIWLYRPFREAAHERVLETRIVQEMKPGAILAGGSWEVNVPEMGWQPIVDDTLFAPDGVGCIWRGAWQKPA